MASQQVHITKSYTRKYKKTTKIKRTKAKQMHPTTDCCVHKVHSK